MTITRSASCTELDACLMIVERHERCSMLCRRPLRPTDVEYCCVHNRSSACPRVDCWRPHTRRFGPRREASAACLLCNGPLQGDPCPCCLLYVRHNFASSKFCWPLYVHLMYLEKRQSAVDAGPSRQRHCGLSMAVIHLCSPASARCTRRACMMRRHAPSPIPPPFPVLCRSPDVPLGLLRHFGIQIPPMLLHLEVGIAL